MLVHGSGWVIRVTMTSGSSTVRDGGFVLCFTGNGDHRDTPSIYWFTFILINVVTTELKTKFCHQHDIMIGRLWIDPMLDITQNNH